MSSLVRSNTVAANLLPSRPRSGAYLGKFSRNSREITANCSGSISFSPLFVSASFVVLSPFSPFLFVAPFKFGREGRVGKEGAATAVTLFNNACALISPSLFSKNGANSFSRGTGRKLPKLSGKLALMRYGLSNNTSLSASLICALAAAAVSSTNRFCTKLPFGLSKISAPSFASVMAASVSASLVFDDVCRISALALLLLSCAALILLAVSVLITFWVVV
mmetsp:Transcript_23456/g.35202  ORF Transcript_23456/g.35202 Transcript_23456/m.35202 type:complete len:221 (-) Transcript_23456:170-832(-)